MSYSFWCAKYWHVSRERFGKFDSACGKNYLVRAPKISEAA
ncbi:hypothetical protein [Candidatus Lariskella endosymbiont of Hedychridium roseum]